MRDAIILLIVIFSATFLGTFVPQLDTYGPVVGPGRAASLAAQHPDLVKMYGPVITRIIEFTQFNDLYNAFWYRLLLGWMCASAVVCNFKRYRLLYKRNFAPRVSTSEAEVGKWRDKLTGRVALAPVEAKDRITQALHSLGFKARETQEPDGAVSLYADKHNLGNWGSFLLHNGVVLIFVGCVLNWLLGFSMHRVVVAEKTKTDEIIDNDNRVSKLPLDLRLNKFEIRTDPRSGDALAYRSFVTLRDKKSGREWDTIIQMNSPLTHRGLVYFQSDFGMEDVTVRVTGPGGYDEVAVWPVRTGSQDGGRIYVVNPHSFLRVENKATRDLFAIVPNPLWPVAPFYDQKRARMQPWPSKGGPGDLPVNPAVNLQVLERDSQQPKDLGWIAKGIPVKYKGYTIALDGHRKYSLFTVSKDPGYWLVNLGFLLLVGGAAVSFYMSQKLVRAVIRPQEGGCSVAIGGRSRSGAFDFGPIEKRIRDALQLEAI